MAYKSTIVQPLSGVSSLNSLTGAINLTSTGSTVSVTPSGSSVDLEVSGSSKLATVNNVDGKAIANTALYVSPAGKTTIITGYTIRCTAASSISNGPSAGLGNIAGSNNISASQAMNTLTSTSSIFEWYIFGVSISTSAGSTIYYNQGTGASGTSQTLSIDLFGYSF